MQLVSGTVIGAGQDVAEGAVVPGSNSPRDAFTSVGGARHGAAAPPTRSCVTAPDTDAFFCGNDQIARGVTDALRERGVSVPADIAVVGYGNRDTVSLAVHGVVPVGGAGVRPRKS